MTISTRKTKAGGYEIVRANPLLKRSSNLGLPIAKSIDWKVAIGHQETVLKHLKSVGKAANTLENAVDKAIREIKELL